MKTLKELSAITGYNVVEANFHEEKCYWLLIQANSGYYKAYYVEGQQMGITPKGTSSSKGRLPYKRKPEFKGNVK